MGYCQRICGAMLLAACMVVAGRAWAQVKPGIVVEEVAKNSEGEKAGLQPGDVLLGWSRSDAKGKIDSPFDLWDAEIEQEPRGNATLEGLRGEEKRVWVMGPDDWGVKARPDLLQELLSVYLEGEELAKAGKLTQAVERWQAVSVESQKYSSPSLQVWLLFHSAQQLTDARQLKQADELYQQAARQSAATSPSIAAQVFETWALTYQERNDWAKAESCYRQSLVESEKSPADSLMVAAILSKLGVMSRDRGDLAHAEDYHQRALEIRQRLAPDSLAVANSFNNLGTVAEDYGHLDKEDEYLRQALTIGERLAPGGLCVAQTLNQIGDSYWVRGNILKADEYFRQAFAIREKLAPGSAEFAISLNNRGIIAEVNSDFAEADRFYQQALAIRERIWPESLDVAKTLHNLASVADNRGDVALATWRFRRALVIWEKVAPQNAIIPAVLVNLGTITRQRNDLVKAEEYYRRGLESAKRISPNSQFVPLGLLNLGELAKERGELDKAEKYLHQALAHYHRLSPHTHHYTEAGVLIDLGMIREKRRDLRGAENYFRQALEIGLTVSSNLGVATIMQRLGDIARERGDIIQAEEQYRKALAMREKVVPNGADHSESLAALAGIMRIQRKPDDAAKLYQQALNALESQTARMGDSEQIRAGFRSKYANYYRDYIDLLIEQQKPSMAFDVLERLRARTLLETLATAHVDIRNGVDTALVEKERTLAELLSAKSSGRIELLSHPHSAEQLAVLDKEIENALEQDQDVNEQIRANSPAYAALTQPKALTAGQVQQELLDSDTVLLEYSLGKDRSYVFAVTPDSLNAREIPKRETIERSARHLYRLLRTWQPVGGGKSSAQPAQLREAEVRRVSAALSRIVLGPVASQLQGKRVLIVSDGALQYIPFAMLPAPEPAPAGNAHSRRLMLPLIAEHEVINLPSASVLGALRQQMSARTAPAEAVAVLADPVFDKDDERVRAVAAVRKSASARSIGLDSGSDAASDPRSSTQDPQDTEEVNEHLTRSLTDIHGAAKRGAYLARLPYTRREAKAILAVTPAGEAMQALDFDASRATAFDPKLSQYRIVHIATHGLLDSEHPELSGLVLSLVDKQGNKQDGFLGLQDIYNLNLPADLVVLSACETGLGKEINGEGLVGLTRGFMYAGAGRVMASLWKVDDVATAELMRRFYQGVEQQGMRPAAALQKAQVEMWKQPRWRDPYYWAAFQLQGEWK